VPPTLASIGATPDFKGLLADFRGLLLVAGIAGSGKTTTQAAVMRYFADGRGLGVETIASCIEYPMVATGAFAVDRETPTHATTLAAAIEGATTRGIDVISLAAQPDPAAMRALLDGLDRGVSFVVSVTASSTRACLSHVLNSFPAHAASRAARVVSAHIAGIVFQTLVPAEGPKGLIANFEVSDRERSLELMRSVAAGARGTQPSASSTSA
jgi:Tfp pilus assembly pilus retraction ATPase PilT